jgi:hypothetical protein
MCEDIKLRKRKGEKLKKNLELNGGKTKKYIRIQENKKENSSKKEKLT